MCHYSDLIYFILMCHREIMGINKDVITVSLKKIGVIGKLLL